MTVNDEVLALIAALRALSATVYEIRVYDVRVSAREE